MNFKKTIYRGYRTQKGGIVVKSDGLTLEPRTDLLKAETVSFDWGPSQKDNTTGLDQLAISILADYTGEELVALVLYPSFVWSVLRNFNKEGFHITDQEIDDFITAAKEQFLCPSDYFLYTENN